MCLLCGNGKRPRPVPHNQIFPVVRLMMNAIARRFHLLPAHARYIESPARCPDFLACFQFVRGKLRLLLLQKLRYLLKVPTVYIVGGVLPVLMKHDYIRNGKAVSFEIFRVVDIEPGKNVVKGRSRHKGRGIDKLIVRPVNGKPRRLQAVVRLKAVVPCFVPVL